MQDYNATIYHYAIANIYLMNRIYNNGDFYIGLPVLNRLGKNKKVIGPYIKVMPIGIAEKEYKNFRDLLGRITDSVYKGYKHLRYPMNEIGEKIGANGLLYNVTFSYQRTHYPEKISNIPIKVL